MLADTTEEKTPAKPASSSPKKKERFRGVIISHKDTYCFVKDKGSKGNVIRPTTEEFFLHESQVRPFFGVLTLGDELEWKDVEKNAKSSSILKPRIVQLKKTKRSLLQVAVRASPFQFTKHPGIWPALTSSLQSQEDLVTFLTWLGLTTCSPPEKCPDSFLIEFLPSTSRDFFTYFKQQGKTPQAFAFLARIIPLAPYLYRTFLTQALRSCFPLFRT